jgi:hypothetical protein
MAMMAIYYSPENDSMSVDQRAYPSHFRMASLSLAEGLEGRDVYEVARKLAELLLEQMASDEVSR